MTTVIANSHAITQPLNKIQFGGKHERRIGNTPVTSFGSAKPGKHAAGSTEASMIRDRQALSPGLGSVHGRHAKL
jgi:hypothetical protein